MKKWHYQDPPDAYEISRNDFLDSLQGNRNPFIDSARYACYIDFSNMSYIANPTYTTGVNFPWYVASRVGFKENSSSQKLLEKLGLKFVKMVRIPNDEVELMLYELTFSK